MSRRKHTTLLGNETLEELQKELCHGNVAAARKLCAIEATELRLDSLRLNKSAIHALGISLKDNKQIDTLSLRDCALGQLPFQCLENLASTFAQNTSIKKLDLSSNNIDDFAAQSLVKILPPNLEYLDLRHNLLGLTSAGIGYQALSFALRKSNVSTLLLSDNGNDGLAAFLSDLRRCKKLSFLYLNSNQPSEVNKHFDCIDRSAQIVLNALARKKSDLRLCFTDQDGFTLNTINKKVHRHYGNEKKGDLDLAMKATPRSVAPTPTSVSFSVHL